jgi:hypothetical protein
VDNRGPGYRGAESSTTEGLGFLIEQACPQDVFLRRLKRALLLRFYTDSLLSAGDRRLLDRVIYSSFCDCQEAGATLEARRLLGEARAGVGLFRRTSARAGGDHEWSI